MAAVASQSDASLSDEFRYFELFNRRLWGIVELESSFSVVLPAEPSDSIPRRTWRCTGQRIAQTDRPASFRGIRPSFPTPSASELPVESSAKWHPTATGQRDSSWSDQPNQLPTTTTTGIFLKKLVTVSADNEQRFSVMLKRRRKKWCHCLINTNPIHKELRLNFVKGCRLVENNSDILKSF